MKNSGELITLLSACALSSMFTPAASALSPLPCEHFKPYVCAPFEAPPALQAQPVSDFAIFLVRSGLARCEMVPAARPIGGIVMPTQAPGKFYLHSRQLPATEGCAWTVTIPLAGAFPIEPGSRRAK